MTEFHDATKFKLNRAVEVFKQDLSYASSELKEAEKTLACCAQKVSSLQRQITDHERLLEFIEGTEAQTSGNCSGCAEGCSKCDPCVGYGCRGGEGK